MDTTFRMIARRLALLSLSVMAATAPAATLRSLTSVQIVGNLPFDRQLAAARSLGVGVVRFSIRRGDARMPGMFDQRAADMKMRAARSAGLGVLLTLFGGNQAYRGDAAAAAGGDTLDGFPRYAAAVVKRYGTGTPAAPFIYELWNEPNTKSFWGAPPSPEGYARMAQAACERIKAADPAATVLALATEGTPVKAPYFVPAYGIDIYQEWARRAATPGLMACADGISMHPYRGRPETYLDDEPALARFVAAHWRKARPPIIANSEWGYAMKPGRTDADQQAALDLRLLLVGTGMKRLTSLYQVMDTGADPARADRSSGLIAMDGRPKQAGMAVKRLLDAIGDHEVVDVGPLPGQPGVIRFRARGAGGVDEILWTSGAPIAVPARGAGWIDLVSGQARPAAGGTIQVDGQPILMAAAGRQPAAPHR